VNIWRSAALVALAALAVGGLIAVPSLWPGLARHEVAAEEFLCFGSGWLTCASWPRDRRAR